MAYVFGARLAIVALPFRHLAPQPATQYARTWTLMRVFISWSGPRSQALASTLRDWLPAALQYVEPFMSAKDIEKGARWSAELAAELASCNYGIICVTRENMTSRWLNFEAGAISKVVDQARVAPLAVDLSEADITGPLSLFQVTKRSKEEVARLLSSMNSSAGDEALPDNVLTTVIEKWWPDLDAGWGRALEVAEEITYAAAERSEREILEEILALMRNQNRIASQLSPASMPRRRRVSRQLDLTDEETRRIVTERVAERIRVDPSEFRLEDIAGRLFVLLETEPTEEQRRLVSEWSGPFGLDVVLRGPRPLGLSDLVATD